VRRALPDTGSTFKLRAAGSFKPIGRLTAVGTVHGTGFIDRGRELLRLTLSGSRGLLELIGRSSAVPAFTSP
jgi:hypothetical protein